MTVYLQDPDVTLLHGDVLEQLATLPDESVHCVVTSPPYWGLRDYGTDSWVGGDPDCDHRLPATGGNPLQGPNKGNNNNEAMPFKDVCGKCGAQRTDHQLGLEPTPDAYVARMVEVFREVRRVLRRDGTVWCNIGDSYAASRSYQVSDSKHKAHDFADSNAMSVPPGLKPKDLVGIPWRLAFALQADGWYLRADIIWAKPNPMPESVTDRPTKSHEYVFLLTRSPRYYWDAEAVRERFSDNTHSRGRVAYGEPAGKVAEPGSGIKSNSSFRAATWGQEGQAPTRPPQSETLDGSGGEAPRGPDGRRVTHVEGQNGSVQHRDGERWPNAGRNVRSVWEIATQPYPEAHFATFPEELARRCILAGTSERGCCPVCGAPWVREVERVDTGQRQKMADGWDTGEGGHGTVHRNGREKGEPGMPITVARTLGWRPSCDHGQPDLTPILTPTGERAGEDPSLTTGRAGMNRPRGDNEGRRPITRYEQQQYAAALRASPARPQMEAEAGEAFAHYIRTDYSGARPVPPDLLETWIGRGFLERVEIPEASPPAPIPCTVLDPFVGSGTVPHVARKHGRHSIGIDLNLAYIELAARRLQQLRLDFTEASA